MSLQELRAQLADKKAQLERMTDNDAVDADEFDAVYGEAEQLKTRIEKIERLERGVADGTYSVTSGDGARTRGIVDKTRDLWDADIRTESTGDTLARARNIVEGHDRAPDGQKELITGMIDRGDVRAATWAQAVANPAYRSAFWLAVTDPDKAFYRMSDSERRAFNEVEIAWRAASLTDSEGGFAVPFELDQSGLINLGDGSSGAFDRFSKVVTISSDTYNPIAHTEISAEWLAEAGTAADGNPTWSQPSIPVHKASVFVPYSVELGQDTYGGWQDDLAEAMMRAHRNLENTAFVTGSGTGQPTGIVTAVGGTANAGNTVGTALTVDNLYECTVSLPAAYRDDAVWVMDIDTINTIRAFGSAVSHEFITDLADGSPPRLLGKPLYEASGYEAQGAGTAVYNLGTYGAFNQGYTIVRRIGTRVESVPHLFDGTTGRITGQRALWMFARTGADSVNDNAFVSLCTEIT